MARTLQGKTALVTGGAKRIGRALAASLAENGVNIVVHYGQSRDDAQAVAAECEALGVNSWILHADLALPKAPIELVEAATKAAGSLDIVINNASIFPKDTLADFTPQSLEQNVRVNAFAPAAIARTFAKNAPSGDILNLLDARMDDYDRDHVAYHLSKRMLYALTRMMAEEFAPSFRVNAIAPGLVLPPEGEDEAYLENLKESNPMKAYGCANDIAEAAHYLLTAEFTTGQVLYVDGGRHMRGGIYG